MSRAAEVVGAQARGVADWVDGLPDGDFERPSVLAGWRVAELVVHLALMMESFARVAGSSSPEKPLTIAQYVAGYAPAAAAIRDRELELTKDRTPADLRTMLRQGIDAAATITPPTGTVTGGRGTPIRWDDWLTTRVIELVVHADDLARSLPDRDAPEMTRPAVKLTVSSLAKALAERAPGRSVELRVPPYAAVQCVEGPRHTRGTPPNVVEMDPLTWVRLAAGRLGWDDAISTHTVRASGPRADLGPWLPIL